MPSKREQLLEIMEDAARGETKATLRARIAELEEENERLRKALERIEVRTRSVPSDTAEDDKRDKYHANSIARRALTGGEF